MRALPKDLISRIAAEHGLDRNLVAAIVLQESSGIAQAKRFEPAYRYFYKVDEFAKALDLHPDTEKDGQATSYGLMQVMGAVCREKGFKGFFTDLFDPETNLKYGCQHLKTYLDRYKNLEDAIASYNAGSPRRDAATGKYVNQAYVTSVLSRKEKLDRDSNGT